MGEIHGIVEIQRQAWKMEDLEIVATFEMKAVADIGILIVAVDINDIPIGFIYGFPQFPDAHYSHMMATLPSWQGKGVGFELKKFHRNIALESPYNIQSINWTVDPLLPNNAYLNFAKLGCVCSTYYVDYYGDPEVVGIYQGVPTDRLLLNWFIRDERVKRRLKKYKIDRIDKTTLFDQSQCINSIENGSWIDLETETLFDSFLVQIPANFQETKKISIDLAVEWRVKFRNICQKYFIEGWEIIDFHSFLENNQRENYYEFQKVKES